MVGEAPAASQHVESTQHHPDPSKPAQSLETADDKRLSERAGSKREKKHTKSPERDKTESATNTVVGNTSPKKIVISPSTSNRSNGSQHSSQNQSKSDKPKMEDWDAFDGDMDYSAPPPKYSSLSSDGKHHKDKSHHKLLKHKHHSSDESLEWCLTDQIDDDDGQYGADAFMDDTRDSENMGFRNGNATAFENRVNSYDNDNNGDNDADAEDDEDTLLTRRDDKKEAKHAKSSTSHFRSPKSSTKSASKSSTPRSSSTSSAKSSGLCNKSYKSPIPSDNSVNRVDLKPISLFRQLPSVASPLSPNVILDGLPNENGNGSEGSSTDTPSNAKDDLAILALTPSCDEALAVDSARRNSDPEVSSAKKKKVPAATLL